MTKDDILQALRLTAMGRAGHQLQQELAEKLEEAFARKCKCGEPAFDVAQGAELIKRTRKKAE